MIDIIDISQQMLVYQSLNQIMRVSLNQANLEPGTVKAESPILFNITDHQSYLVNIERTETNEVISMRGHIEGNPANIFLLSAQDKAVLASLEIIEENVLYVIITNPQSGNHYLFKTPADKIGRLECGGPLMPPEKNGDDQDLLLFHDLHEIKRDAYISQYGKQRLLDNPVAAAAERIGKVKINTAIFEPGRLEPGDGLLLPVFDETKYHAYIDTITHEAVLSIRARIAEHRFGMLVVTFADNKVLATLELAEKNTIYLLNYNPVSGKHYLFKAPLDKVERLEDAPAPTPPGNDNNRTINKTIRPPDI